VTYIRDGKTQAWILLWRKSRQALSKDGGNGEQQDNLKVHISLIEAVWMADGREEGIFECGTGRNVRGHDKFQDCR